MKRHISYILLIFAFTSANAQSFIEKQLRNHSWASAPVNSDHELDKQKKLALMMLRIEKDSIENDISIWEIRNDSLFIINHFNDKSRERDTLTYRIEFEENKNALRLYKPNSDKRYKRYTLGITSIGNFITMTRDD